MSAIKITETIRKSVQVSSIDDQQGIVIREDVFAEKVAITVIKNNGVTFDRLSVEFRKDDFECILCSYASHMGTLEIRKLVLDEQSPEAPQHAKLDRPIEDLDFGRRVENVLLLNGFKTLGDLVSKSERELLAMPSMGRANMRVIHAVLEEIGLKLKEA